MKIPPTVEGRFVRRENRFRVVVEVAGVLRWAHLPNSGRLRELLTPGRLCYLVPRFAPNRRTDLDLLLMADGETLVSVDARLPGPLFAEALEGGLSGWEGVVRIEREVRCGESRLDFRLEGPAGPVWVETKSVTLVEGGVALFPDAPTLRGQRHLRHLADLARAGEGAAVVFVVQRPDAEAFAPNARADPALTALLAEGAAAGVRVYAYGCMVSREEVRLARPLPV
ncbi:MAG: DNA/RNA nuclease SfsA, partial [Thermoflexia bacterium]